MAKRVDLVKVIAEFEAEGIDFELPVEKKRETDGSPYAWASMVSLSDNESCSLSSAYSIISSYDSTFKPTNLSVALPDQGGSNYQLASIMAEGVAAEKKIAKAILWKYKDAKWNYRVDGVGKADFVINDEVIEIKCTVRSVPQDKWIAQICIYMHALDMKLGQLVLVSRSNQYITSFYVTRKNNLFTVIGPSFYKQLSHEEIALSMMNLQNRLDNIYTQEPPFSLPFSINNGNLNLHPCLYSRDDLSLGWYVRCNGIAKTGEQCKNRVANDYFCKYHKNQLESLEETTSGTIVNGISQIKEPLRIKINCAWFGKCWGVSEEYIEIHKDNEGYYYIDYNGRKRFFS